MGGAASGEITVEDGRLLLDTHIPRNNDKFWSKFWGTDARQVIWITLDPQFLRYLMERRPENFYTLMYKTVAHLETLVRCRRSIDDGQKEEVVACVRILTRCLQSANEETEDSFASRYLWRSLPQPPLGKPPLEIQDAGVVCEHNDSSAKGDSDEKFVPPNPPAPRPLTSKEKKMLKDRASATRSAKTDSHSSSSFDSSRAGASSKEKQDSQLGKLDDLPLAERIVSVLMKLLFIPGVTLPAASDVTIGSDGITLTPVSSYDFEIEEGVKGAFSTFTNLMWEKGLESLPAAAASGGNDKRTTSGVTSNNPLELADDEDIVPPPPVGSSYIDANRVAVLECILVCLGKPLFTPPQQLRTRRNKWAELFVSHRNRLGGTCLLSLLNIICNFRIEAPSLYTYLTTYVDQRIELVDASLQVVLVLLDHRPPEQKFSSDADKKRMIKRTKSEIDSGVMEAPEGQPQEKTSYETDDRENGMMSLLKDLRHPLQIKRIYRSICQLLNASMQSSSYFASDPLECFQESFVLLWKLLEENSLFLQVVVNECDVLPLVRSLLYFMFECRNDASKLGLLYSCVFILLRLSGEREFCVSLNKAYDGQLQISLPHFKGTHADLMILICQKVVVSSAEHLNSMLNGVLTVISNCSPYITSLSMITSVKLVNLFELVSKPKFLYGAPHHPEYVKSMLEIFNNLIQYQYAGCPDLVYAVVRRSRLFFALTKVPEFLHDTEKAELKGLVRGLANGNDKRTGKPPDAKENVAVDISAETRAVIEEARANEAKEARETKTTEGKLDGISSKVEDGSAAVEGNEGKAGEDSKLKISQGREANGKEGKKGAKSGHAPEPAGAHGPQGVSFRPTKPWVKAWQRQLPLETVLRLLDFLLPKFQRKLEKEALTSTDELLQIVKSTTLVGVLPAPHPIIVHKYIPNSNTTSWFSTFLWGVVYLRNPALFARERIKLFPVYDVSEEDESIL